MTTRRKPRPAPEYRASTPKREPTHPGEIIAEALEHAGVSIMAAAKALGTSRQTLYRLIAKDMRVSPELAVRLGAFFGNGAGIWIRMQADCDVWHAERAAKPRVVPIGALAGLSPAERSRVAQRRGPRDR